MTETPVTRTTVGLIVAIALAIYGAMRGATSVIGALNVTYGERETRNFAQTTGLSAAFTIGAVLVAIVAMAAISAMTLVGTLIRLPGSVAPLVTGGLWIATALMASGLVAVVYRYGPDRENARWTWLTPGAVFASVGALLATFLFGSYVTYFAGYNATYGTLGTVVSFLMWLYVTAFVVLLGAELNAEVERQTAEDTTAGPTAAMGDRGASMADTCADGPADTGDQSSAKASESRPEDAVPAWLPIAAGLLASQVARRLGDTKVGLVSMTLIASGLALAGQRSRRGRAIACLALGAAMTLGAKPAPGAAESDDGKRTRA